MSERIVIFSDLDGTLLDHDTYSHEAANEAIEIVRENNVTVVQGDDPALAPFLAPARAERLGWPMAMSWAGARKGVCCSGSVLRVSTAGQYCSLRLQS